MRVTAGDWGAQIRRFRRLNGLKQAALADLLGVDQATVSRWESRGYVPDLATQRRLRDMMRGALRDEALLKHGFAVSLHQMMLSNAKRVIQAASLSYSAAHGVPQPDIIGRCTDPMATDDVMQLWWLVYKRGFFRGDVASVTLVTAANSLSGHKRNRLAKVVWLPIRLADGEILRHVERRDLSEDEFRQEWAANGGPIRIVGMDELCA